MSEKVLEVYYDHYKETNLFSKESQTRRNKSYVSLCVLEVLSFMMIKNQEFACGLLNDTVRKKLETTIVFSGSILQTFIWISIAYVLIRYVQDALYIEKQYRYLDLLEKKITEKLGESETDFVFGREGDFYLMDYTMILNFIDLFYKVLSPIIFSVINTVRIIQEWNSNKSILVLICDTVFFIDIIIITLLYFFNIHDKITLWFMRYPFIKRIVGIFRKMLKEV